MYRIWLVSLLAAGCLAIASPALAARDYCPGKFNVMRGYRGPSACAQMGLSNRGGVCQPDHRYETLCDDAPGGRYKTCQGPRRCDRGNYVKPFLPHR